MGSFSGFAIQGHFGVVAHAIAEVAVDRYPHADVPVLTHRVPLLGSGLTGGWRATNSQ